MSFIIQRKHNECAVAVTLFVLEYYKIQTNYKSVKLLLFNDYSFLKMKNVFSLFNLSSYCIESTKKNIEYFVFDVAIAQIRKTIGYHFVCFYKENEKIMVFDPNLGIKFPYNERIKKKWTGYILLTFK